MPHLAPKHHNLWQLHEVRSHCIEHILQLIDHWYQSFHLGHRLAWENTFFTENFEQKAAGKIFQAKFFNTTDISPHSSTSFKFFNCQNFKFPTNIHPNSPKNQNLSQKRPQFPKNHHKIIVNHLFNFMEHVILH